MMVADPDKEGETVQMTVLWHLDDLNISSRNKFEIT